MEIKEILIESQYEEALKRVEELWDAEPDTEESILLMQYIKLIDEYENKDQSFDHPNYD